MDSHESLFNPQNKILYDEPMIGKNNDLTLYDPQQQQVQANHGDFSQGVIIENAKIRSPI